MSQLEFDDGLARYLEDLYQRRDYVRRRELALAELAAAPGERILDAGCGSGIYVEDLLGQVGADGAVTGVDASPAMLAIAAQRLRGHDNVELHEATLTPLPVADGEFDAALSVQVLEYVPEIAAALAEIHRALRPGGRVVIWDVDWATVSWHARDPARMRRVLDAWDRHLVHRSLPQVLAARLRDAGFADVAVRAHPSATTELDPQTYGGALAELVPQYAVDQGGLDAADADAWKAEQATLAERGEFFFACLQFCFSARKPD